MKESIEVPKAMSCNTWFGFRCYDWWFTYATMGVSILSYFRSFLFLAAWFWRITFASYCSKEG